MKLLALAVALLPLTLPASRAIACEEEDHDDHDDHDDESAQDDDEDDELDHGPRMGVELLEITPELRLFFGAHEDVGVLVSRVERGSPAERAGIRVGDVIVRADGDTIEDTEKLVHMVQHAGGRFEVEVIRAHERERHEVRMDENPMARALKRGLRKHIRELRARLEELERKFEDD